MELEISEVNTIWLALTIAIIKQNELAQLHNEEIFIRDDFNQLKIKIEKWQRKQTRKPIKINI